MKRRTKLSIESFDSLDARLKKIADDEQKIKALESDMNREMLKIKEGYEEQIKEIKKSISNNEKDISKFLKANKSKFQEVRSKNLTYGVVGFQKGQKHLSKKSRKDSWDSIADKFFDLFGEKYVILKKTLNKNSVVTAFKNKNLTEEQLALGGVKIVQKDEPFYKLDIEEIQE